MTYVGLIVEENPRFSRGWLTMPLMVHGEPKKWIGERRSSATVSWSTGGLGSALSSQTSRHWLTSPAALDHPLWLPFRVASARFRADSATYWRLA